MEKEMEKEKNFDKNIRFEGEYLRGKKWNGKGYDKINNMVYEIKGGKGLAKEYDYFNDNILFEGEYINGEENEKGKECCVLSFEGEYLNGKKLKGKEYIYQKLVFEGEYLYNQRRKGKEYDYDSNNKLVFDGEYLFRRKWNGKGYDEN